MKLIRVGDRLIGEADVGSFYAQHGNGKCIPTNVIKLLIKHYDDKDWNRFWKDFDILRRLIK